MQRRLFTSTLLISALGCYESASASGAGVAILASVVALVAAAGDAMAKMTAGLRALGAAGRDAQGYAKAMSAQGALQDLVRKMDLVQYNKEVEIVPRLKTYLDLPTEELTDQQWTDVVHRLSVAFARVHEIIESMSAMEGDLVMESAFRELRTALGSRTVLVGKLMQMPTPRTKSELDVLRQLVDQYQRLIHEGTVATNALAAYHKSLSCVTYGLCAKPS